MRLMHYLADVPHPITGAVFRIMSRRFVNELCRLRERHRLLHRAHRLGRVQADVGRSRPRQRYAGETKYGLGKMLKLAADTVTAFSAKPLYFVLYLGGAVSAGALLFGISVIVRYFLWGFSTQGWASLMTAITFFSGLDPVHARRHRPVHRPDLRADEGSADLHRRRGARRRRRRPRIGR